MYNSDWAQSVVKSWWMCCTRVALLNDVYKKVYASSTLYNPETPIRILPEDLKYLLIASSVNRDAREAWNWVKKVEKDHYIHGHELLEAPYAAKWHIIIQCGILKGRVYHQPRLF